MLLGTHTVDGHAQPTDRSIEQSLGNSNHLGSYMCVFLFIFSHHFNFDDFCRLLGAIFYDLFSHKFVSCSLVFYIFFILNILKILKIQIQTGQFSLNQQDRSVPVLSVFVKADQFLSVSE
jgi:hypothetical protein